jgi:hypothetical protein
LFIIFSGFHAMSIALTCRTAAVCLALVAVRPAAHASEACPWSPGNVSGAAKPVELQSVRKLPASANIRQIVAQIGPAARETGFGVYVLEWDMADGQVFSVSAESACSVPLARKIKPRRPAQ